MNIKKLQYTNTHTNKTDTQHSSHLHSFIKEKYNHTRSTHCSALLKNVDNEDEPFHANGPKENTGRQMHQLTTSESEHVRYYEMFPVKTDEISAERDVH